MSLTITIAGAHGTGKTTIGKKLRNHFNLDYRSAGQTFREMAAEKDMSCTEFNRYACENPEIDKKIDKTMLELAKKGDIVLDGTIAAWIAKDYSTINILLITPLDIRIERIAKRDNISFEEAKKATLDREKYEKGRFKELYDINIEDHSIYDISINTHSFEIDSMIKILITAIKEILNEKNK
ncbi:MAG: AAA family ATPase [Candidatus Lokiarchaeota archaeon]|nr:AAA family ATPase [Candidatus Lokiarchaeota archaeon]